MKKNKFFLFLPLLAVAAIIPCVLITSCSQTLSSTRHFRCSSNMGEWNADLSTPFQNDPDFNKKTKEEKIDYINSKLTLSTISDNLIYTMRNWISDTFFTIVNVLNYYNEIKPIHYLQHLSIHLKIITLSLLKVKLILMQIIVDQFITIKIYH